ncbi:hypothetical protein QTP88_025904 [Uroleucon formosanum]
MLYAAAISATQVSSDVSSLLASMVPADLVANERARMRQRLDNQEDTTSKSVMKKQERTISIRAWQSRWDRSSNGRWMHRLLPDVGRWLSRPPIGLTYHLTQALSGHECYKSYLYDRGRVDDSLCCYCMNPDDTAEHTLFACPRWEDERAGMTRILRRVPAPEDVEDILCGPLADTLPDDAASRSRLI